MNRSFVVVSVCMLLVACTPASSETCSASNCAGCCDAKGQCQSGVANDACGSFGNQCFACSLGQQCSFGACSTPQQCTPATCQSAGKNCGTLSDGCGGTLDCGGCSQDESCGGSGVANVCGPGTCTPDTCLAHGYDCGRLSDGCSTLLDCGVCASGSACGGGGTNKCGACAPTTCAAQGKNCGAISNGCGGTLECGTCAGADSCGGGGTANVCGHGACTATTCLAEGKDCGSISDGCGNQLQCGTCGGGLSCGGGGTANVCGAMCNAGCPDGFQCNASGVCTGGMLDSLVLNEIGYQVSGTIQVNGADPVFASSTYCTTSGNLNDAIAQVRFTDASKGYTALVYVRCNSNFAFDTLLPPGTYDVRVETSTYSGSAGINLLPVSYQANAALTVNAPVTNLMLNEVGYQVSGTIQVNGAAPTFLSPTYCTTSGNLNDAIAQVRFTDSSKGYSALVYVRCNSNFAFDTLLPPGTYDVRVETSTYSGSAGINLLPVSYQVNSALAVNAPVTNLVLNEVGYQVSGTIQVNGAAPTFLSPTYCTSSGNLNDAIAQVRFTDSSKGYTALVYVRCNSNFAFDTLLPPGTYDVRVETSTYSGSSGINLLPLSYQANAALTVNAATTNLVLNEIGYQVSGTIQVNGADPVFASSTYCTTSGNLNDAIAQVRFTDSSKGYSALVYVRCNSNFAFDTLLPPGTYDVRVETSTYSGSAGINLLPVSYQANAALTVNAATTNLVLNEIGYQVSGVIQVNGADPVFASSTYCTSSGNLNDAIAQVRFTDSSKGYSALVYVRCNSNFAFSTLLPAGVYEVRVETSTYSGSAGINLLPVSYQANAALTVNAATTNLVLNELGYQVSGVIQVNGADPVFASSTYCTTSGNLNDAIAQVRFIEPTKGYTALVYVRCNSNFAFSTLLPAGVYEVRVETSTYSGSAGINLLPVSYQAVTRLQVP